MQDDGLVYVRKDTIELKSVQRLKLAVRALSLGGDIEQVASYLSWQEFEEMASVALEQNGYGVMRNLRFKHAGRKWEMDIVGCRKPLAICIDCKHWHHSLRPSAIKEVEKEQIERTKALARSLPNPTIRIECAKWERVKFVPVVLSLMQGETKFYEKVPIVSVLQLQDFVDRLPAYSHMIYQITKTKEESLSLGHDF
jgi:Holliday junction resolvase-like predicted endonuclease